MIYLAGWATWSSWSCVNTCGFLSGVQQRTRTCANADPVPGSGIDGCPGETSDTSAANCSIINSDRRWGMDITCPIGTNSTVADPGLPVGGQPRRRDANFQRAYVSKNLYVKIKKNGTLGAHADPPIYFRNYQNLKCGKLACIIIFVFSSITC